MPSSEQQRRQQEVVCERIREDASLSKAHLLMNALAATIASYGLFANSPAAVIGAMIVAMLLGPIIGISLALVDSDTRTLRRSFLSLILGAGVVLAISFMVGTLHRDIPITPEIIARTSPNILDLMIALAGGAACAYATVSFRLSVALVGVAIATALVPPLSSTGILLARGETSLAAGAISLAFVNFVAIQFSASVVLWLTGFRRVTQASGQPIPQFIRQNLISILILVALGISLSVNSHRVVAAQSYESKVRSILQHEVDSSAGSRLVSTSFERLPGKIIVAAVVHGQNPPSPTRVASIEDRLPSPPDGSIAMLRIRFVQILIIDRLGPVNSDAKFEGKE